MMVSSKAAAHPYEPTWESLKHYQVPEWYRDAKFGIFIHWGVYCVPAFGNEWYPRNMYLPTQPEYQHHLERWGNHQDFGYKDFIPLFTAERFDADAWAELFEAAGARYVVPVAEHHDGFAMYDSALTPWNAARMGPRRDIVGELAQAVRRRDLAFGVSSHRAEHWWFFNGGMAFDSDVRDPSNGGLYHPATPYSGEWRSLDWVPRPDGKFLDNWLARCVELVDKYQPQVFWFDWWIEQTVFEPYRQKFAAHYYNRGQEWDHGVVINFKNQAYPVEAAVFDIERGKLDDIRPYTWQTDTSISYKSWGYIENDSFRTVTSVVQDLVDIVSKNGNLLLNVGPKADGTIPEEAATVLRGVGKWLAVNGEAIYGTRPWVSYGEGPTGVPTAFHEAEQQTYTPADIRYTRRDGALYAILMDWPGTRCTLTKLAQGSALHAAAIARVELLGDGQPLAWSQDAQGLHVTLPETRIGDHAHTLKLTLKQ